MRVDACGDYGCKGRRVIEALPPMESAIDGSILYTGLTDASTHAGKDKAVESSLILGTVQIHYYAKKHSLAN